MTRVSFEPGEKLRRLQKNAEKPSKAQKGVGALMVAAYQQAFKEEKLGRHAWSARAVPNVYGIIADFHEGKEQPPDRRFQRRPVLQNTGRLAASIADRPIGRYVVEVGSSLPYAGVLHHGGEIESEQITKDIQQKLWDWLQDEGRRWKPMLKWLLADRRRDTRLVGKVKARPFVGLTKQLEKDIVEELGIQIFEAES